MKLQKMSIPCDTDLSMKISVADANVRGIPGIYERARQLMRLRCEASLCINGSNFEHLL